MSVDSAGMAARLGIKPGMVVQELGWDEDADEDLRDAIVDLSGGEMVDEDTDEVADVVILWWREDDGDLVDALVDAIASLADDGVVWLLCPSRGARAMSSPATSPRRRRRPGCPDEQHLRGQGLVGHPSGDPEGGPLAPLMKDHPPPHLARSARGPEGWPFRYVASRTAPWGHDALRRRRRPRLLASRPGQAGRLPR